jgi:putative transcriptional regulator
VDESLRGHLLIASPSLSDYFRRTVVLLVEHGEDGAMGVILNRPSEHRVVEAVPALAEVAASDDVVFDGGPVNPGAVVALGEFGDPEEAARLVVGPVGLLDPDRASPVSLTRVRVYAGYAGWAPGQLESELEAEGWIVEAADPEDLFHAGDLWSSALRRKGGEYALLARMPADPSLN